MMITLLLATASVGSGPAQTAEPATIADGGFRAISPTHAMIRIGPPASQQTVDIQTVDEALAALADQRLAPMWPRISTWAGPGLEDLRDRRIAEARSIFAKGRTKDADTAIASVVRPRLRPTFLLADALFVGGRVTEAVDLMRAARAAEPKDNPWWLIHWASMSQWLAKVEDR